MRLDIVFLCLGLAMMLRPAPVARAPQFLRAFSRRTGLEFGLDERGRLAAGPQAEVLLSGLVWRLTRAVGCALTGFSLSYVLLASGPPLSRSSANSFATAAALCMGMIGPYLFA